MERIKKQITLANFVQFIKLQLAGNVLFWGTYIGYFVLHDVLDWRSITALVVASLAAHVAFFIIDKEWVFDTKTGKEKTTSEVVKFALFMGLNFFINLGIITGLERYFDISPYIGQFIAALFFTFWTYFGLKLWVFDTHPHSLLTKRRHASHRQ